MSLRACLASLLFATLAIANTEKAIFVAPPPTVTPDAGPTFDDLHLDSLSPDQLSLRLSLPVAFPSEAEPQGLDSWYLLEGLSEGQRYEVRTCWAAVQPTAFTIDTFNIMHVFDTSSLITSLADFSESRAQQPPLETKQRSGARQGSILFLRIQSGADYHTTNETLMRHPPPVDVDIILDPYLANVFPQSLVPTAGYITVLAAGSWFLSGAIWNRVFSAKQHSD